MIRNNDKTPFEMYLKYEMDIDGTLEQVWDVLVDSKYVKEIYTVILIESNFKVGDLFACVGSGSDGDRTIHVYGTVLDYSQLDD